MGEIGRRRSGMALTAAGAAIGPTALFVRTWQTPLRTCAGDPCLLLAGRMLLPTAMVALAAGAVYALYRSRAAGLAYAAVCCVFAFLAYALAGMSGWALVAGPLAVAAALLSPTPPRRTVHRVEWLGPLAVGAIGLWALGIASVSGTG